MDMKGHDEEDAPWLNKWDNSSNHQDGFHIDDENCIGTNSKKATEEGSDLPQIVASLIMASFHIVVGFSLAYSAILIPQLESETSDIPVTKTESSWIASSLVLMGPIGALLAGILMEYAGRVNTMQIAAIPCIIGWCAIALGQNVWMILAGRILTGISAGLMTSPAIVYITEVAKPKYRGMLISTGPGLASLGMLLAYTKGAFLDWRIVAWTSLIHILFPMVLIRFFVPESPVWLVARGRTDEAGESLNRLAGKKNTVSVHQLAALVKSQDMKALVLKSFSERLYTAVLQPTGYKPLLILTVLFFFQQFTGIYVTLFYAVTFFEDVGSGLDPSIASILVGCMRVTMSCCNMALMRRFCRRPLFMVSCLGMTVCMTVSGIFTQLVIQDGKKQYGWVPVACVLLYVCTSMIGMLSIPWTMTAEMFPTEIRGIAHGVILSIAHVFMFLSLQAYRPMVSLLGGAHVVQWIFAGMSIAAIIFIWLFLPETHNKTLAEIEQYFRENNLYINQKNSKKRSKMFPMVNGTPLQQIDETKSIEVDT